MNPLTAETQFKEGQIIKMSVAERSHVTKPYYVKVKKWNGFSLTLTIPDEHDLTIKLYSYEWYYHVPRMIIVGSGSHWEELLYNQDLT